MSIRPIALKISRTARISPLWPPPHTLPHFSLCSAGSNYPLYPHTLSSLVTPHSVVIYIHRYYCPTPPPSLPTTDLFWFFRDTDTQYPWISKQVLANLRYRPPIDRSPSLSHCYGFTSSETYHRPHPQPSPRTPPPFLFLPNHQHLFHRQSPRVCLLTPLVVPRKPYSHTQQVSIPVPFPLSATLRSDPPPHNVTTN